MKSVSTCGIYSMPPHLSNEIEPSREPAGYGFPARMRFRNKVVHPEVLQPMKAMLSAWSQSRWQQEHTDRWHPMGGPLSWWENVNRSPTHIYFKFIFSFSFLFQMRPIGLHTGGAVNINENLHRESIWRPMERSWISFDALSDSFYLLTSSTHRSSCSRECGPNLSH